ncbi:MAG TPA: dihydropteroate synthase [Pirellulales bacterium]|nr:dihydropteroate synthase [Pirellulales bacterium]
MPDRPRSWRLRSTRLEFPSRPLVMGILNVTPDSFSDGGRFASTAAAIEHGLRLADEGADLIDVGGESTRPYSQAIEEAEELRRVLPVVQRLAETSKVPVSIDTSKSIVAREAVAAGAEIINDVTALTGDSRMLGVALETGAAVCAMHMLGTPQNMQDDPQYDDVVGEVLEHLRRRRNALLEAGIAADRIALDPGIGFGKTHEHNLTLVANCHRFHELGCPLLVGHSRKGFIGKIIGDKTADRTAGTLGVSLALANQGVQILRVHDVAPTLHALKLYIAAGGLDR